MKINIFLFLFIFFYFLLPGLIKGQIIHVPTDQSSIQQGIDVANIGDTVLVEDGTYVENIFFKGKAITVASNYIMDGDTNHINNTIIDGSQATNPDSAAVVTFGSGEDTTSILSGFTIMSGAGFREPLFHILIGGGITCFNAGAKISHNKIIGNVVSDTDYAFGGGIGAVTFSGINWLVIDNNVIKNNTVHTISIEAYGGGIYVGTNARISNNIIESNNTQCDVGITKGSGFYCGSIFSIDSLSFYNNIVRNNIANGKYVLGGGLSLYNLKFHLTDNQVMDNTAIASTNWNGAGIWMRQMQGICKINNNTISGNHGNKTGGSKGGGIFIAYADFNEVLIDGNAILDNSAYYGGGISTWDAFNIFFINNLFANDSAKYGGALDIFYYTDDTDDKSKLFEIETCYPKPGIRSVDSARTVIINNTFSRNKADIRGGAMYPRDYPGKVVVINSIFWDNNAPSGEDIYQHNGARDMSIENCDINPENIVGSWTGHENINEDPLFVDPQNGDFHLTEISPCAGAGIDSLKINGTMYYCPSIDFENDPRPMPFTSMPDMGADEVDESQGIPRFSEDQSSISMNNYPNPFSSTTTIEYDLQKPGTANISIFNHLGQQVESMEQGNLQPGKQQYVWNASGMPSGVYFVQVRAGMEVGMRKIMKVR